MDAAEKTIQLHTLVQEPRQWTAETPELYTLGLELSNPAGLQKDKIETVIGFKKTEIKDGVFYLNGIPLKVNAQNSHMQHPEEGHVMDEATIRKDFELLKQFNFNAVRTSHYPPVNKYLELANEYGLYIIDEVGDEAHASEWISSLPEYEEMYRERCRRMVLRDRNHPCVLFWSAMKYGYIPCDLFNEAVAYDMEYALADWAVAQVAKELGKTADYDHFLERSKSYRHFFDPQTRFMRGLDSKGRFRTPFNPFRSTHRADDYCEGNAWQYTWLVPHDVEGLIGCFGGKEAFTGKLDSLFVVSSVLEGAASPDISGLIGQYAHGNEPSHHVVYLYTMIGQPWKTADKVREILTTLYHDRPDGLSGNEDVGQMSAWYVLSSLGFYQVEPAGGRYFFGSPLFDKAEVRVRDGVLTVTAHNNSAANKYIQAVKLNGKPYTKPYIAFDDIAAGGVLEFEMGAEPAVWYEL